MPAGAHPSVVQELLEQIRGDFYHDLPPQHFFRDRRMLLYALSWPATWLQQRALTMHPPRYRKLILLFNQIKTHADRDKLAVYFPAYLLKSLQQYLFHHGEMKNSSMCAMLSNPYAEVPSIQSRRLQPPGLHSGWSTAFSTRRKLPPPNSSPSPSKSPHLFTSSSP